MYVCMYVCIRSLLEPASDFFYFDIVCLRRESHDQKRRQIFIYLFIASNYVFGIYEGGVIDGEVYTPVWS